MKAALAASAPLFSARAGPQICIFLAVVGVRLLARE